MPRCIATAELFRRCSGNDVRARDKPRELILSSCRSLDKPARASVPPPTPRLRSLCIYIPPPCVTFADGNYVHGTAQRCFDAGLSAKPIIYIYIY